MKKTILFIYYGECFKLPPFLTIIDSLKDEFTIKILCYESENNLSKLQALYISDDVSFINSGNRNVGTRTLSLRIKEKLSRLLKIETTFHNKVKQALHTKDFDKLWIIHENTLFEIRDLLTGIRYTFSMYELNDARIGFLNKISNAIKSADEIVVAEFNRASILRTWMNLPKTPTVLPNKPLKHPHDRFIKLNEDYGLYGTKVILYQGHIQKNRKIDTICEAISNMNGYTLVLMGNKTDYCDELQHQYPKIKFIDFVNPPDHLNITSHAYIGIVKYDYVDLNSIFCAPNKTFEYAGFGIPMIANNIPGLINSVGKYNAAECIETDDVEGIRRAILKIDSNYDSYSQGSLNFFNSINVKSLIMNIAKNNEVI